MPLKHAVSQEGYVFWVQKNNADF